MWWNSLPLGFWREVGISGLFPYLSLLNLLVGNKGSRREREDAHLLCYTLERQLLLALVFMATAQRLVGFLVLFLLWLFWHWKILLWDSGKKWTSDGCVCLLHPTTSTSKLLDVVTCGYLLVFLIIIWLLHIFDCGGSVLTLLEKDTTVDWSLLHSKGSLYVPMDASCPRSFHLWKNPVHSWSLRIYLCS